MWRRMSISASYVFSRALRLPMFIDSNLQPATASKSYDITNVAGVTQSSITEPFYTSRIDPTGLAPGDYFAVALRSLRPDVRDDVARADLVV